MHTTILNSSDLRRFTRTTIALAAIFFATANAFAYGPVGHKMVGAIADEKLAGKPAAQKVKDLLDGMPLERVAIMPDEIKGWDKKGVDDPKAFHYTSHPVLDKQLSDFWRANPPTHDMNGPAPSHHWFHYTDVPVDRPEKYADGKAGRGKWDVVQMIPYCVDVLQGKIPNENDRKITKTVAVILLAHYVGDIHQPLHVGALYFNNEGKAVDPNKETGALGDEGGNTIYLHLRGDPPRGPVPHSQKLHSFWDNDTVMAQLPPVPETLKGGKERAAFVDPAMKELAHKLATEEPKSWRIPEKTELKKFAEYWADDILPEAKEAHDRLIFNNVRPKPEEDRVVAQGDADEKTMPDGVAYKDWATKVVREEIHKAGWRLADLLEKCLSGTSEPAKETMSNAAVAAPAMASASPAASASPTASASASPEASPVGEDSTGD